MVEAFTVTFGGKKRGSGKKLRNGHQKGSFRKGCYIYYECPQGMVSSWMGLKAHEKVEREHEL